MISGTDANETVLPKMETYLGIKCNKDNHCVTDANETVLPKMETYLGIKCKKKPIVRNVRGRDIFHELEEYRCIRRGAPTFL